MVALVGELESLLSQDISEIRQWETHAFDLASAGRPIVLMGAGELGRRTVEALRQKSVFPVAFADNSQALQGKTIDGLEVLSPKEAARMFGARAVFVVTIWTGTSSHRYEHSRAQLQALGCTTVSSFAPLFWKYADALLPFYLQDLPSRVLMDRVEVRRAFDVWADDASRAEYVAQVRFRLMGDFDGLPHPVSHMQYFPDDLFLWSPDEWLVDVGAYDGDTLRNIQERYSGSFSHILALEPDPFSFAKLQRTIESFPSNVQSKVTCRQIAVGRAPGVLSFNATGRPSSGPTVSTGSDKVLVHVETIDGLLGGTRPTFLKLDIEGAELNALIGSRETIVSSSPVIAVCVYHRQADLWKIPLLLRRWCPEHAFFLRPHNEEGWELVCYAIPRRRLRRRTD